VVGGIELAPRPGAAGMRAMEAHIKCFEQGALVRFTGDIIALSPPLIIEKQQIDELVGIIADVLKEIA
jgi:beta-alanine--pyruvate transaminase